MKLNKHFRVVLLGSVLILIISFCVFKVFSKREKVITFGMFAGSYWEVPYGDCYSIIDKAIERFEEENSNVKVEYVSGILKDDYSEWLSGEILKGKAPDVFMILPEDFNTLASIGAMKNLDNLISSDEEFYADKYYEVSYQCGQYEDNQYALPYESVPTMMFVNKTLLNKEGIEIPSNDWTWDDFYNICKQVTKDTDGDGKIDQFGYYDYKWTDAVYSNKAILFDKDGSNAYFAEKSVVEAIKFVKDLDSINKGYKTTAKDFDDGKVAFRPLLFSDYSTYKTYPWKIKKYSNFEWDCIKLPAGKRGENISQVSTLLMGMSNNTNNEDLAWEFLKMLTYDLETQKGIFEHSQGVSVIKEVTNSKDVIDYLNRSTPNGSYIDMNLLNEVMEDAVISPRFKKYESVMAMADNVIRQAIENENEDISYLLLKLQREVNNMLNN